MNYSGMHSRTRSGKHHAALGLGIVCLGLLISACGGGGGGGGSNNGGTGGPGGSGNAVNWTDAAPVSPSVSSQRDMSSVIAPDGTTTFFWVQNTGGNNEIFARRLNIDSDNPIDSTDKISGTPNTASAPKAVVDSLGNVTVTWMETDSGVLSAYANRFDASTGTWAGPVVLENFSDSASPPLIAVNAAT